MRRAVSAPASITFGCWGPMRRAPASRALSACLTAAAAIGLAPALPAQAPLSVEDVLREARAANARLPLPALELSIARSRQREALAAHLINKVVPDAELDDAVAEWASKLAGKSPVIMRLGKEAMRRQLDMPLDDALDYLRAQLSLAQSTEDIVEGVSAFFEKREPVWKGR